MLSFCYIYLLICILLFFNFFCFVQYASCTSRKRYPTCQTYRIRIRRHPGDRQKFLWWMGYVCFFTLFLPFFSPSLLLPSPTNFLFPFASVRSGVPLNQIRDLGRRCKLPQRGLGQSPNRKRIRCTLVRKPLVAIILSILKCMFYSIGL